MPMCQPGREVPDQGLVTQRFVFEECWGEVWRAEHEQHGAVLFVAFTSAVGIAGFKKALPYLEKWKAGGIMSSEGILQIHKISTDTAIPYLLTEDPGGKTLREFASNDEKVVDATSLMKWGSGICETLLSMFNMSLMPVGITPDTIFYDAKKPNTPWRLLPIFPGITDQARLLANGRYTAPELAASTDPVNMNADTYSLAWILSDILTGDYQMPHEIAALEQLLPAPKLIEVLKAADRFQGSDYLAPHMFDTAIKRWVRNEAEKDLKQFRKMQKNPKARNKNAAKGKAVKPTKSKPAKSSSGGGKIFIVFLKLLIVIAAMIGGAIFGYKLVHHLFVTPKTDQTASGAAQLYIESVVHHDMTTALSYTTDAGAYGTRTMLESITNWEKNGNISTMSSAAGLTTAIQDEQKKIYVGETTLMGAAGEPIMIVKLRIQQQPDESYRVIEVIWKEFPTVGSFGL